MLVIIEIILSIKRITGTMVVAYAASTENDNKLFITIVLKELEEWKLQVKVDS